MMESEDDHPPQIPEIPKVFTMVSQPVQSRIIPAFGLTGRALTGVCHIVPMETQVKAMQAYMPVSRVAVIYTPSESNSSLAVSLLRETCVRFGIEVDEFPAPDGDDGLPDAGALGRLVEDAAPGHGPGAAFRLPDSCVA